MSLNLDLLAILRCPACVTDARLSHQDPGRLDLVHDETWFICVEAGCGRKYPIKEGIPVMLVEEGERWINTAVADLP